MISRRDMLQKTAAGAATMVATPLFAQSAGDVLPTRGRQAGARLPVNGTSSGRYRPRFRVGIGGTQSGNCFAATTDAETDAKYEAAWAGGLRHFDTSPFYGRGLSERRLGSFLHDRDRDGYELSSKIGRVLSATTTPLPEDPFFKDQAPFAARFDYSAAGARRSIEDSLQRLGVSRLDIVYIHDVSPDNRELPGGWEAAYEECVRGCIPELARMRDEGLIRGWGFGVNTPNAPRRAAAGGVAVPDVHLLACQYSILDHQDALANTFPALMRAGTSVVLGTPLNAGFVAGRERFNFGPSIPPAMLDKRRRLATACERFGVDMRTAALQFAAAPPVVAAIIPGSRSAAQAQANIASMSVAIPPDFWTALRRERLISADAPVPTA